MTMTNITYQVRVNGKLSGSFATTKGLRQGDDVAEAYQGIEQAAESLGLQINEANTKLMVATSADPPINNQNLRKRDVQIGERTFEVVPQFTYHG